jgi:general secretion pathway protein C
MKKGDLVKTINGYDMTNPDKAIEAYGKLKTARKVSVVLERDGAPLTLDYNLK